MLKITFALLAVASLGLTAFAADAETKAAAKKYTTASGLEIEEVRAGEGEAAKSGDKVTVNYTGWLTDGTKFDSSVGKKPFSFNLGAGEVIKGWDEGVAGMKPGAKRKLTIPAKLAYGDRDVGNGLIPAGSTLIFDVELIKAEATK